MHSILKYLRAVDNLTPMKQSWGIEGCLAPGPAVLVLEAQVPHQTAAAAMHRNCIEESVFLRYCIDLSLANRSVKYVGAGSLPTSREYVGEARAGIEDWKCRSTV